MKQKDVKKPTLIGRVIGVLFVAAGIFSLQVALAMDQRETQRIFLYLFSLYAIPIGLFKIGILKPHRGGGFPSFSGGR